MVLGTSGEQQKWRLLEQQQQLDEEWETRWDLEAQLAQATHVVQQIQSETELVCLRALADENKK